MAEIKDLDDKDANLWLIFSNRERPEIGDEVEIAIRARVAVTKAYDKYFSSTLVHKNQLKMDSTIKQYTDILSSNRDYPEICEYASTNRNHTGKLAKAKAKLTPEDDSLVAKIDKLVEETETEGLKLPKCGRLLIKYWISISDFRVSKQKLLNHFGSVEELDQFCPYLKDPECLVT